jgi:hypothetical protein
MSASQDQPRSAAPYIGPDPFESGMALYGRDQDLLRLIHLLVSERILLMYSPSGAGKTSLIQAGLIPALEKPGGGPVRLTKVFQVSPPMRVGDQVPPTLGVANRYVGSALAKLPDWGRSMATGSVATTLTDHFKAADAGNAHRVLVFDQFEEILTADRTDRKVKEEFFRQVGELLEDPRFLALFSMREEYLAGLDPFIGAIPNRFRSRFRLDYLTVAQARDAILKPLPAGFEFDRQALEALLTDLRRLPTREASAAPLLSETIEPYQLQVVCTRLWEAPDRAPGKITAEDVKRHGDVRTALGAYYADKVRQIAEANEASISERALREWIEDKLISPRGFRSKVVVEPSGTLDGLSQDVLRRLVKAWLVGEDTRPDGSSQFELSHDRLIEPVRDDNVRWFKRHRPPFRDRALAWVKGSRPNQLLLRGADLADATRWRKENPSEALTAPEVDYHGRSLEVRQIRRRRRLAARSAERRTNLADLGWGLIVPHDLDPAVLDALRPLLDHRKAQATAKSDALFKEFTGQAAYRPGMTYQQFLDRHDVRVGPPDYSKVPYYLLIVGNPTQVPWEFQYGLDIAYAVGRLHFDTPEEYARYARSVVQSETAPRRSLRPPQAVLFGTRHLRDPSTRQLFERLVVPLFESTKRIAPPGWEIKGVLDTEATRRTLQELLGGPQTPALLFTATHRMSWPLDNALQRPSQGALLCQEWPGFGKISPDHYLGASDIPDDARLGGLIAFFFSAYSAGTPLNDDFPAMALEPPRQVASEPFIAALPRRLLGHPSGPALAVIGHVERTWGYSITSESDSRTSDIVHFEICIKRLLNGYTVGSAVELFNLRYARAAQRLSEDLRRVVVHGAQETEKDQLYGAIVKTIDARNFVILGDPAVRLPTPIAPRGASRQPSDVLVFNGIDGSSGEYLLPRLTLEHVAAMARGEDSDPAHFADLIRQLERINQPHL